MIMLACLLSSYSPDEANRVVILLSILSAGGIAVPLSPASPVGELKYILEDSQAKTLIATEKYAQKARDVLSAVDWKPELKIRGKTESRVGSMLDIETGDIRYPTVEVTGGGLMLYTSGTTSRPVCMYLVLCGRLTRIERRVAVSDSPHRAGEVTGQSMGVFIFGLRPPSPPAASYSRDGQCAVSPAASRVMHRVHLSV